ncbi:MAG TPA: RNA-directed DNA polymerase [Actinomycetota bacterium]|nr:RNA-directed DNA polymerase [Actinomycetota bacterium]
MDTRSSRPRGRGDDHGPRSEPIPKPGGGLRWITRLDPAGDAEYRQAVSPLAGRIEGALGPEVFAIRTRPAPGGWRPAPWAPARAAWRKALRHAIDEPTRGTAFAVADVRDCYGSISPETVDALLGPEAAHAVAFLRRLRERGVRGLPIGPYPSAIVANAVLREMDRAIRGTGARHARWVDDVFLWGTHDEVRRALVALGESANAWGLALHERKTRHLADPDEARVVALGERDSSIIAAP